jgi:hypothetical protein
MGRGETGLTVGLNSMLEIIGRYDGLEDFVVEEETDFS